MNAQETLRKKIAEKRDQIVELQRALTAVPALGPQNGGTGEWDKAQVLISWLGRLGLGPCELHPSPDQRVPKGERPNVIVTIPGRASESTFWIMSHLDIVPPGEMSLWTSDPYTLVVDGDRLIGRGVEDNQQGLVASVFAAVCVQELGLTPARTVKLLFVADEETGSQLGVQYLVAKGGLFRAQDRALVPDGGSADGSQIEIAEKSILWLRFKVKGQAMPCVHAAERDQRFRGGITSCRAPRRACRSFPGHGCPLRASRLHVHTYQEGSKRTQHQHSPR